MSQRLLKNVDWIIPVPNKDNNDNVERNNMSSNEFTIKHNGAITKWNLKVNFNDRGSQHLATYLTPTYDGIDFDMQITFIVLNWIDANESISSTSSKLDKDWRKGVGWGICNLLAHEELFEEESRFIKDGKLQLIVVIKEHLSQKNNEKNPPESSMNQLDAVQFGELFDAITSYDDSITLQTADGMKIAASRNIIAKKSIVLATMFEIDMEEKSRGVVEIIDFSGKVMKELLRFMYCGRVESIEDVDMKLYNAAKVYQVEGLGDICLKSIKSRVGLSSVFEMIQFADRHDDVDLFECCCEIIARFFTIESIQEQIKKLSSKVQNRVLTESFKLRCNSDVFCGVTVPDCEYIPPANETQMRMRRRRR